MFSFFQRQITQNFCDENKQNSSDLIFDSDIGPDKISKVILNVRNTRLSVAKIFLMRFDVMDVYLKN